MHWVDTLSIGIADIDAQHQKLILIADRFEKAAREEQALAELGHTLKELVDYTNYHFTSEEDVMAAACYPQLGPHHILHEQLIAQIREILLKLKAGQVPRPTEIVRFLSEWVTTHILSDDMKIGKHLRKRWAEHGDGDPVISDLSITLAVLRNRLRQSQITDDSYGRELSARMNTFAAGVGTLTPQRVREIHSALQTFSSDGLLPPALSTRTMSTLLGGAVVPSLLTALPSGEERDRFRSWLNEECLHKT